MSKFGILIECAIFIRYSYIPISYRDTTRAVFMNIACLHCRAQKELNALQYR